MIKVALVTTWPPELCGIATYAEELVKNSKGVAFKIIQRPLTGPDILKQVGDVDIVHVNHAWSLFGALHRQHINTLKLMGKKTVCTFHESTSHNVNDFTQGFDRVVVHHKNTTDGYTFIPHGIPDVDVESVFWKGEWLGMAGFPFGFKNYELAASVAQASGMKLMAHIPENQHIDVKPIVDTLKRLNPGCMLYKNFGTHEEVAKDLATCAMTMAPYNHAGGGVSGSARMCISAKRPCIIPQGARFIDMIEGYSDELYVMPTNEPDFNSLINAVELVSNDVIAGIDKRPNRLTKEFSWRESARKYNELYKELLG